MIGEKDPEKREVLWAKLDQMMSQINKQQLALSHEFIQKANTLLLHHRESLKQQEDTLDLEQLEENF